jgi:hypothetical protein
MIRYYLDVQVPLLAASRCDHPMLVRLKGRGPWSASDSPSGVRIQRGTAAAWGEIRHGLDGLRYQLADPLPPVSAIAVRDVGPVAWVDLPGVRLPVKLATYAPVAVGLDGKPEGPADDYGRTSAALWDRMNAGELPILDPLLVQFCVLALMTQTDLTPELIHAYGLINTDTIPQIFDAANGVPKAEAGGGL